MEKQIDGFLRWKHKIKLPGISLQYQSIFWNIQYYIIYKVLYSIIYYSSIQCL